MCIKIQKCQRKKAMKQNYVPAYLQLETYFSKKTTVKEYNKSNLIYNISYTFYKYHIVKHIDNL